jgi:hypothetical protein
MHSAFTDQALNHGSEPRNPNHHRAILALSTAFWDTYLRADTAARNWLDSVGPKFGFAEVIDLGAGYDRARRLHDGAGLSTKKCRTGEQPPAKTI